MRRRGRKTKRRKRSRSTINECLEAALDLHRNGRLAEAEQAYLQVLRVNPDRPDALHLLGMLSHKMGKCDDAIRLIRKAISLQPDYAAAQNDLGNLLHEVRQLEEAAAVFHKLIERKPDHADAYNNLGVVLKDQGKFAEAIAAYKKAIDLNPNNAGVHYNLGNALKRKGRLQEAAAAYHRAIALQPNHIHGYRKLAATLRRAGKLDDAQKVLQQWLQRQPNNPIATHVLAAYSSEDAPSRASDDYVRQLFDEFASTFDEHLRELDYRGPQLIADAVAEELGTAAKSLDVLDAGCGTRLCGPLLRPYAGTLVGVDLSPAMLNRARQLDVYDHLVTAELTAYLNESALAFDLIAAADTLNYFGTLEPVLAAVASALREGGHVIFALEKDEDRPLEVGYRLNPHGRYSHSEDYLKRCLAEAGLTVRGIRSDILRTEADQLVIGFVVRARKGPSHSAQQRSMGVAFSRQPAN